MRVFAIVFIGWLVSVCLHEFGHALTAYAGGDASVRRRGYLTNPLKYIHPVNSIVMPLVFLVVGRIGLPGAAVRINEASLRSRLWRVAVSLAGPAMNAIVAVLLAAPFLLGKWSAQDRSVIVVSVAVLAYLQVFAVVLNLLPVPPLDGFQAIAGLLFPDSVKRFVMRYSGWMMLGLFVVLYREPSTREAFGDVISFVGAKLGLDAEMIAHGWQEFRFWK